MFDQPTDPEREAKRKQAYALVDAVIDVDPATAMGSELTQLMAARAELAAITDGAAVAAMAQWEASADRAADGSATVVTHLVTRARKPEVAEVFDRDEALLVAEAKTLAADALSARLVAWRYGALAELGRNEPDRDPDHCSDADTARIVTGFAGRGLIILDLTPVALATIVDAVHARIETWRRAGQLNEDTRTWEELIGAAIVDLIADGSVSTRQRAGPRRACRAVGGDRPSVRTAQSPSAKPGTGMRRSWSSRIQAAVATAR